MSAIDHKQCAPVKLPRKGVHRVRALETGLCNGRRAPAHRLDTRESRARAATTASAHGRKPRHRPGRILMVGVALAALALSGSALARPVTIVWSTFMRTGPGTGYDVVDELDHDTVVDLRTCGPRWCQIVSGPAVGYVDKDSLTLPRLPEGGAPVGAQQGCFVTGQYAWRQPSPTRFCQTRPEH